MRKIYIAGPMRGRPNGNLPAFDEAEARWREAGWQVMSPAAMVRALGYVQAASPGTNFHQADRAHLNHVFQIDFACLFASDAVALLPGWERSAGATAELALAQVLGLEVYDAVTRERINPPCRPWSSQYRPPVWGEGVGHSY